VNFITVLQTRSMSRAVSAAIALLACAAAPSAAVGRDTDDSGAQQPLRFRADGTFKIVQFADLHYGEG
jgi:hypothetical protein